MTPNECGDTTLSGTVRSEQCLQSGVVCVCSVWLVAVVVVVVVAVVVVFAIVIVVVLDVVNNVSSAIKEAVSINLCRNTATNNYVISDEKHCFTESLQNFLLTIYLHLKNWNL